MKVLRFGWGSFHLLLPVLIPNFQLGGMFFEKLERVIQLIRKYVYLKRMTELEVHLVHLDLDRVLDLVMVGNRMDFDFGFCLN